MITSIALMVRSVERIQWIGVKRGVNGKKYIQRSKERS